MNFFSSVSVIGLLGLLQCVLFGIKYRGYVVSNYVQSESFPLQFDLMILLFSAMTLVGLIYSLGDFRVFILNSKDERNDRSWDTLCERTDFCPASSPRGKYIKRLIEKTIPNAPSKPRNS